MVGVEGDDVYKMVSSNSEEILRTHLCMCVCVSLYIIKLGQRERETERKWYSKWTKMLTLVWLSDWTEEASTGDKREGTKNIQIEVIKKKKKDQGNKTQIEPWKTNSKMEYTN